MLVSKEVVGALGRSQHDIEERVRRLQALVVQCGLPELEGEVSALAGTLHNHGGLLRAVLEVITEDTLPPRERGKPK